MATSMRHDRSSDPQNRSLQRLALVSLLLLATPAAGVESMRLALDAVEGDGWSAHDIEIRARADGGRTGASVRIGEFVAPEPIGDLRDITVRCDSLSVTGSSFECARAQIHILDSPLDDLPFGARLHYEQNSGRLEFETRNLPVGGLRFAVSADWRPAGWTIAAGARDLPAATLYALVGRFLGDLPTIEFGDGSVEITANLTGGATGAGTLDGRLQVRNLSLSNEEGTLASDSLAVSAEFYLGFDPAGAGTDFRVALQSDRGEAYLEPAYIDLGATPITLDAVGEIAEDARHIEIGSLSLRHRDTLSAEANAVLLVGGESVVERAEVEIGEAIFPGVYRTYLQGFLVGTPFAKLETAGRLDGRVLVADDELASLDLNLEGLQADDRDRRIALYDAGGQLRWRRSPDERPARSRLRWGGGFLYRIGFGAAEAEMLFTADRFSLPEGLKVPVLDGALIIETLETAGLESETPSVDFDARLEPIGLRRLTTAFGWPAFPGTLSGELRQLTLRDGVVTVGGSLVARLFDGSARVSGLRIEQPFGPGRRGAADIRLEGLDLALVTDVFTFGRIEGRLDGEVRGLRTLQSRPIAFDASFYTPPDDRSRHRISRRALNNLSEIAGAGTALLSGGFLSFFQDFGYSSLGISCRLEGDVCHMSGVEPAEVGYYLVKGKGLPRIDVIGHSREVNWPRLVSQIEAALESREATTNESSEGRR